MEKQRARTLRIFECFVAVGLDANSDPSSSPTPSIKLQYSDASNSNVFIPKDLPTLCFPESSQQHVMDEKKNSFSFSIMGDDGRLVYGFCQRVTFAPHANQKPATLCILTLFPYYSLYSNILHIASQLLLMDGQALMRIPDHIPRPLLHFLSSVLKHPFPMAGESFSVSASDSSEYRLMRPEEDDAFLSEISYTALFASMSLNQVLSLFSLLLSQRRILFVSSNTNKLSSCCHAATSLLYPFSWQHTFVPVLPPRLAHYATASAPFVIGVHADTHAGISKSLAEDIAVFSLDDKSSADYESSLAFLPQAPLQTLKSNLQQLLLQWDRSSLINDNAVASSFLLFFVTIVGNYRRFIQQDGPRLVLNRDALVANSMPQFKQFLESFKQSAMFDQFVLDREAIAQSMRDGTPPMGAFERYIASCSNQATSSYLTNIRSDVTEKFSLLREKVKTKAAFTKQGSASNLEVKKDFVVEKPSPKPQESGLDSGRRFSRMIGLVTDKSAIRNSMCSSSLVVTTYEISRVPFDAPFYQLHARFAPPDVPVSLQETSLLLDDLDQSGAVAALSIQPKGPELLDLISFDVPLGTAPVASPQSASLLDMDFSSVQSFPQTSTNKAIGTQAIQPSDEDIWGLMAAASSQPQTTTDDLLGAFASTPSTPISPQSAKGKPPVSQTDSLLLDL
eukprot:TRINITY_DN6054_c0_g1_i8.p1 TRINITY_DN6054_c0_g1~~TRINITY_DN6054_c0_g1_i8.p1  ORF type:complete len:677 (+),score=130.66 TRINITY_DN6054_c0_g1_i8:54-2084(+)